MSAYVVDRNHILYLLEAATANMNHIGGAHRFYWHHNDEAHYLEACDFDEMERVANMLWQENVRSVMYRYPNDSMSELPGPIGEDYRITRNDFHLTWLLIDPVQVLKACKCYEYQSCEHPAWESSEAYAFIQTLKEDAISALPGYDGAVWGVPAPYSGNAIRIA